MFKSEAQRKHMQKHHPEIAKRWEESTDKTTELPDRIKPKQTGANPELLKALKRLQNG